MCLPTHCQFVESDIQVLILKNSNSIHEFVLVMHNDIVFRYRYRLRTNFTDIDMTKLSNILSISILCNLKFLFSIYINFGSESMSKND